VRNVLLGEDETDKASSTEASARSRPEHPTKVMAQRPVTSGNPKKKFKKVGGGKKMSSQETRRCFFCKKKGHLRAECFGWKALQKKKGNETNKNYDSSEDKKGTAMRLMWTGELGDAENPPVPILVVKSEDEVPTVASSHDWMLDSGAGAHVCVNGGSFVKLMKDPLVTLDWQGCMGTNEHSGLIRLEVQPGKYLELPAVRYAPGGTVNLISQRLLELTGWKPSYSDTDNERLRYKYFDKDGIRLGSRRMEMGSIG
jgi:hypothetical protein